jgi:hypothetical protein
MQTRVLNFSRPLYIRDVMVRNGDADKPIWLSEMAWNAVPLELGIPPIYGHWSEEQQARFTVQAYERIQAEWPWLGVANYWFLKQASDQELKDGNPQYFFRLLEPDFTPLPVYEALKAANRQPPVMQRGYHQEDHWAVTYDENWTTEADEAAVFGQLRQSTKAEATLHFNFTGSRLRIVTLPAKTNSAIDLQIDDAPAERIDLPDPNGRPQEVTLFTGPPNVAHTVSLTVVGEAPVRIDGFIVYNNYNRFLSYAGSGLMVVAVLGGWLTARRQGSAKT